MQVLLKHKFLRFFLIPYAVFIVLQQNLLMVGIWSQWDRALPFLGDRLDFQNYSDEVLGRLVNIACNDKLNGLGKFECKKNI